MTAERECNLKLGENPEMCTFRLEWIKNIDNIKSLVRGAEAEP
jgi:hypothetical protein